MVAVCSQTGYLLALPVKSKNQMSLITHELLAFTQVLGHEEVQYYSAKSADPQALSDGKVINGPEDDYEDHQDL